MFSVRQKREIAAAVEKILRDTNHPELPSGPIHFLLHVEGVEVWSWADIRNNSSVALGEAIECANQHNEAADSRANEIVNGNGADDANGG